jgi:hypothetical protein
MPVQKWEYMNVAFDMNSWQMIVKPGPSWEDELNRLGDEGWELVTVVGPTSGSKTVHAALLKRPKP